VDLENLGSLELVELMMAFEEAFPDLKFTECATPEDVIRLMRERLGDDPDGGVGALIRGKRPSGSGGASALPEK
jgi:hypothetical protein